MGKINAEWHRANPMPKRPTEDQRIAWHLAHAAHCACREIPESVRRLLVARGITVPPPAARREPTGA